MKTCDGWARDRDAAVNAGEEIMKPTDEQVAEAKKIVGHEGCPHWMDDDHCCAGCAKVKPVALILAARDTKRDEVEAGLRKEISSHLKYIRQLDGKKQAEFESLDDRARALMIADKLVVHDRKLQEKGMEILAAPKWATGVLARLLRSCESRAETAEALVAELRKERDDARIALQDKSQWANKMRQSYEDELDEWHKKYLRREADHIDELAALKAQTGGREG